jgi:hypothetical protein
MRSIVSLLCCASFVVLSGCSTESAKRGTYDLLQNKSDMDCRSNPGANCPEHRGYDEYQRNLNKK